MGLKFRRQHVIEGFVLDFYCHELKLGIEVDGGINPKTAKVSSYYGANIFVSGNYIFSSKRRVAAIKKLRKAVEI